MTSARAAASSTALAAVRGLSIARDAVDRPRAGVSILIYHRVGGGSTSAVDLTPAMFEAQLDHLGRHHTVVSLDEAVRGLSRADPSVNGRVVLTFDDGTADFADVVVPLLVRHHVRATLYLATAFVDEQRRFPWGTPPMSWSAVADAVSTGLVTIGSHTHTHRLLHRGDALSVRDDLDRSIELIGEHTGAAPLHFAYPKAMPGSNDAQAAVAERFRTAALAGSRLNPASSTDLQRLWRTPIQRSDSHRLFARKVRGGMRLEGTVRAAVSRRRDRDASQ